MVLWEDGCNQLETLKDDDWSVVLKDGINDEDEDEEKAEELDSEDEAK